MACHICTVLQVQRRSESSGENLQVGYMYFREGGGGGEKESMLTFYIAVSVMVRSL